MVLLRNQGTCQSQDKNVISILFTKSSTLSYSVFFFIIAAAAAVLQQRTYDVGKTHIIYSMWKENGTLYSFGIRDVIEIQGEKQCMSVVCAICISIFPQKTPFHALCQRDKMMIQNWIQDWFFGFYEILHYFPMDISAHFNGHLLCTWAL